MPNGMSNDEYKYHHFVVCFCLCRGVELTRVQSRFLSLMRNANYMMKENSMDFGLYLTFYGIRREWVCEGLKGLILINLEHSDKSLLSLTGKKAKKARKMVSRCLGVLA